MRKSTISNRYINSRFLTLVTKMTRLSNVFFRDSEWKAALTMVRARPSSSKLKSKCELLLKTLWCEVWCSTFPSPKTLPRIKICLVNNRRIFTKLRESNSPVRRCTSKNTRRMSSKLTFHWRIWILNTKRWTGGISQPTPTVKFDCESNHPKTRLESTLFSTAVTLHSTPCCLKK